MPSELAIQLTTERPAYAATPICVDWELIKQIGHLTGGPKAKGRPGVGAVFFVLWSLVIGAGVCG